MGSIYRVDRVFAPLDLRDLPKADIVLLAIPYPVRGPYYEPLRGCGSALYVEKPFASSAEEHRRICGMFPAHRLACGLQYRSWGPTLAMKRVVEERPFGRLRRVHYGRGETIVRTGGRSKADAGGVLLDLGVHGLDMVLFASGASRAVVESVSMEMDDGFDLHVASRLSLLGEGEDEAVEFEFAVSWLAETQNACVFEFDNASVTVEISGDPALRVNSRRGRGSFVIQPDEGPYPTTPYQTFHAHWRKFLDGVRSESVNHTSAVTSVATTEVLEQMYRTAKQA